jgi:hypothetical protein
MWPRWVCVSGSRNRGVSPAHEHNRRELSNRPTSPISATNTAVVDAVADHAHNLAAVDSV